jgi:hypothetical protein
MNWISEPLWWIPLLSVLCGVIALAALVLKKLGVNINAVWLQGIKNLFFVYLMIDVVVGAIALIQVFGFGKSTYHGFAISFEVLWGLAILWFYFNLFSLKRKAGRVLLDIAVVPVGCLFFIMGVVCIIIGFLGYADLIWKGTLYSWLISIVTGLASGAYFIIMSFSHVRIHENGIVAYVDLIQWSRIESFEWIDNHGKPYMLKLRYKGKRPSFLRNGAIAIPMEKRKQVEAFLEQFLPGV